MNPVAGSRRLRLAFVTRRFGARFGGAEAYGERVMAALADTHDVHVFCQEWDSPLALPHTVLPRRRGLPRWLNLIDFTRRCQALTAGFDVVHSHENSWLGDIQVVHVMPVRYARFQNGRSFRQKLATVLSLRWLAYLRMESLRYRPRPGRTLVAASSLIAQQIDAAYPVTAPCTVITPGVHQPERMPDKIRVRKQLGLDPGLRYGILIANDPVRKGLKAVLRAMAELPEDFHLIVVGGEGEMPQRMRDLAVAAGLSQRVHVWPGQHGVGMYYAAADLCVFPTLGDAFGMVPLEAMAHGLPVVLSNSRYCGFTHHVQPGVDAIVLDDPQDGAEIAGAVRDILHDDSHAQALRRAGLALAASFSWTAIAQAFTVLYAEVAGKQGIPYRE